MNDFSLIKFSQTIHRHYGKMQTITAERDSFVSTNTIVKAPFKILRGKNKKGQVPVKLSTESFISGKTNRAFLTKHKADFMYLSAVLDPASGL